MSPNHKLARTVLSSSDRIHDYTFELELQKLKVGGGVELVFGKKLSLLNQNRGSLALLPPTYLHSLKVPPLGVDPRTH